MSQVRDGDLEKLGILFERHHLRLFNFFLRMTGDRAASEDLVQEVFVRMLKYRKSFRERGELRSPVMGSATREAARRGGQLIPHSGFTSWMFALARNVSADYFGRRPRATVTDEELDERPSGDPLPLEQLELAESLEQLRGALLKLPEEKRELLLLTRSGGLSYEQIAAILGCSAGAVKVRVHRALRHLRQVFRAPEMEAQHGA